MQLEVRNIECRYEDRPAVKDLSMQIEEGDFVCLLGPSGCGKTTALRAIAGFEPLLSGEILLNGTSISRPGYTLAPHKRRLGMVFQDYALFPHMTVCANICFGLRGLSKLAMKNVAESLLNADFRPVIALYSVRSSSTSPLMYECIELREAIEAAENFAT